MKRAADKRFHPETVKLLFNNLKMKRNISIICAIMAMMVASCCGQKPSKPVFNNAVDSVSYSYALARSNGFVDYLVNQMGVDTTYMADFVKGFMEAAKATDSPAKKAYFAGLEIGSSEVGDVFPQISASLFGNDSTKSLNRNNYISGFLAGALNDFSIMSMEDAGFVTDSIAQIIVAQVAEEQYADNKQAGIDFLAAKAAEEGVIALEDGILYEIIKSGNGAIPTEDNTVKVKYAGTLIDGTEFDSSEEGIEFPVLGVIKGWQEILQIMPVGSEWRVYIPSELAYGSQDNGTIKPFSTLIFDMELLDIVK